jgi:hypothetical protein
MRLTLEQKKEALTNFLKSVSKNDELFIYSVNKGKDAMFCIAQKRDGALQTKSKFMNYENMNSFLFGVLAVKENRNNINI